jgi:3-hydroxy-5-methyl-1-naphthoate 3-O-methyltransferase
MSETPRLSSVSAPGGSGRGERPSPLPLTDMATAYWRSLTLFAARRLDLFTHLAERPRTDAELAAATGLPERPLQLILQATAALGLLSKEDGRYANTPLAAAFLVKGSPADLGPALAYAEDQLPLWSRLAECVQSGRPALDAAAYLGGDTKRTRRFVLGMHHRALGTAPAVIAQIDLSDRRRLLDVGGGPGTYAVLMARAQPQLRATVLDLPAVAAIASELVAASGVADRVEVRAADYTADDLGSGFDLALLSGVLHRETAEGASALLEKTARALEPGGRIVISDIMLEGDGTRPPFAALFALQMFLTSPGGGAHTIAAHERWLESAGFTGIQHVTLPPPLHYTVISADRT